MKPIYCQDNRHCLSFILAKRISHSENVEISSSRYHFVEFFLKVATVVHNEILR